MKRPHFYIVVKPILWRGRHVKVFPVMGPTGEIYCAFTIEDAREFRSYCALYRRDNA